MRTKNGPTGAGRPGFALVLESHTRPPPRGSRTERLRPRLVSHKPMRSARGRLGASRGTPLVGASNPLQRRTRYGIPENTGPEAGPACRRPDRPALDPCVGAQRRRAHGTARDRIWLRRDHRHADLPNLEATASMTAATRARRDIVRDAAAAAVSCGARDGSVARGHSRGRAVSWRDSVETYPRARRNRPLRRTRPPWKSAPTTLPSHRKAGDETR